MKKSTYDLFRNIIDDNRNGRHSGIASICSSNRFVLEAAIEQGAEAGLPVLIESTSNQVNQQGGYTGMKPADFRNYIESIYSKGLISSESLILGGDHLGPYPWRKEPAEKAMEKACDLVDSYVRAGFSKIHLDASHPLGEDEREPGGGINIRLIAERTAQLCRVAEKAFEEEYKLNRALEPPVFVIGSEVPVPGGEVEGHVAAPEVTSVSDLEYTIKEAEAAFAKEKLHNAWERVIAVVVQPGVEFGDSIVFPYEHEKNEKLIEFIKNYNLVYEAHSTDYQSAEKLRSMVADGFSILKVGPALSYAMREAVFLLGYMEQEMFGSFVNIKLSEIKEVLNKAENRNRSYWEDYYRGSRYEVELSKKYSYSDRIRYYWNDPEVKESLDRLLVNMESEEIPDGLLKQFFERQYWDVRNQLLKKDPSELIRARIAEVISDYHYAVCKSI